ncbi:MAG TPA: putative toxin-antitoxin system toxin component, PIN family [Thermodesulfobacteriota bacterium]|nr:putative toxin-antitoxin system toxin component, PIN family [Thermodesulfobacteriota bacterium]
MFRVVLDANQFVSAILNQDGPPAKVLNAWREGLFELVISPSIIDEIRKVLNYPRLSKIHKKSPKEIDLFLEDLEILAFVAPEKLSLSVVLDHPTDDKYLVAALEGDAKFIVTGDSDLLTIQEYEGVKILTARAFLKEMELTRRKK